MSKNCQNYGRTKFRASGTANGSRHIKGWAWFHWTGYTKSQYSRNESPHQVISTGFRQVYLPVLQWLITLKITYLRICGHQDRLQPHLSWYLYLGFCWCVYIVQGTLGYLRDIISSNPQYWTSTRLSEDVKKHEATIGNHYKHLQNGLFWFS